MLIDMKTSITFLNSAIVIESYKDSKSIKQDEIQGVIHNTQGKEFTVLLKNERYCIFKAGQECLSRLNSLKAFILNSFPE